MPRAPLHEPGVTALGGISRTTSAGVTPPSSLLRAHAPVLNPPAASAVPSFGRSLQVAVSPCWEEDLPDVTLHICPCVLGPLSRQPLRCMHPFLPSSIGLPPVRKGRRFSIIRACDFARPHFGAAVIPLCSGPRVCSPPRSLLPPGNFHLGSRDLYVRQNMIRYLLVHRIC